jgi:hypothetical protein
MAAVTTRRRGPNWFEARDWIADNRKRFLMNSVMRNKIPLASASQQGFMFFNEKLNRRPLAPVILS